MNILFSTYSLAYQNPGGGERVLNALQLALTQMGHSVTLFNPWKTSSRDLEQFDMIHYFSCIETSFWRFSKSHAPQVPLVVTPTYNPEASVLRKVDLWRQRFIQRRSRKGYLFDVPDYWLPNTQKEAEGLINNLNIQTSKIQVLPNGIESQFLNPDPSLFLSEMKITSPFVLHVGRFHPVKNHLNLIEAVKRARLQAVFIGNPDIGHENYYNKCVEAAKNAERSDPTGTIRILFINQLPHNDPLLSSAFAAAQIFALPSHFETFGISALEAAVAGNELILTKNIASHDLFKDFAYFVDPKNPQEISHALIKAFEKVKSTPRTSSHANARALSLFQHYNWKTICEKLITIYKNIHS